jgi:hypothetical protein
MAGVSISSERVIVGRQHQLTRRDSRGQHQLTRRNSREKY